jgi:acyl transferase domain-containing protein/thioesterase domain-containing protein
MGRELYEHEPAFRETLDLCARHLREPLGIDLIASLYPPEAERDSCAERLNQTWLTQPALFAIEYALAQWWISLGVEPAAMAGHSIGEYVAACLAGVFSLEDALSIVAARGRLIYDLPTGAMLAVPLAAAEIHVNGAISLAAINNPQMCVVSGPAPAIAAYEESLKKRSIACRRLITSHAFHSAMMDPILGAFEERLRSVSFNPPRIPYLSNVTGTWIKPEEATDPAYWARHIRSTVRFSDNLAELMRSPERVLIEAGPGNVLTTLARQQGGRSAKAFPSLPHPRETVPALRCALQTLGQLWTLGVNVDWAKLHAPGSVQRIPLPTYPFERQKFWIEPDKTPSAPATASTSASISASGPAPTPPASGDGRVSLYRRVWKHAAPPDAAAPESGPWLLFRDALGVADKIAAQLKAAKQEIILVDAAASYKQLKQGRCTLRPAVRADYDALVADLLKSGEPPRKIVHLWSVDSETAEPPLEETLDRSFYSPLYLAQALAAQDLSGIEIALVSNHMQQVADEPVRNPARAVLLGPARVLPKELSGIASRSVDLDSNNAAECAIQLIAEMNATQENSTVAWRRGERFVETLEPFHLSAGREHPRLERGGVYIITGGLGALGLTVAEHLAREFQARLVLVGRSALLPASQWESALLDAGRPESEKARIRKLIEIRSLAGGLLLTQSDVTDLGQMRTAVAEARKQFGKIDGIFHAAGVLDDGPLMLKTAENAARVLDPKVGGTLVLEEALRGEHLVCFVLFSSISSSLPPAGQVDYAAANAFLDAFALSRKGPVTAVNWGAWSEIGMTARAMSRTTVQGHPWLEERLLDTPNEIVYAGQFSQQRRWVLSEHKFKNGIALIPGTGHLEMAAGAFTRGSLQGAVEFRDVFFLAPLMFSAGETKEVRVQLRREQEAEAGNNLFRDAFRFSVFSQDGQWAEHSSGIIATCRSHPASAVDRAAIAARCREREYVFDEHNRTRQERQFDFGPRWRSLWRLHIGKAEAFAEIELDEKFSADVATLRQHPALLDMATGAALYLTEDYENCDDLFLPISYRRMCVYRSFPARLFSHIRARQDSQHRGEVETFDITVFDEQNQVLAEIEGFAMRRIADPAKAMENTGTPRDAARANGERLIAVASRPSIPPLEGARTLTRILSADTPAVVVAAPQPLLELGGSVPASASHKPAAAPAPAADEDIESTLAAWWQDLLGVDHAGPDDDFFSLGGHSLIGVRLIAKIKKTFQVDLELAVLFEARTPRQLAQVIRKASAPVYREQKIWSALVPIQPNGSRTPLFCVHAVGGDVLFYQQLAKALGPDQPFYAFQSPLAAEPDRRDITIEDMASLYIKEMRAFFPQGPYLLGAASYGGFVLYEMARQLHEHGVVPAAVIMFDVDVPGSGEFFGTRVKIAKFLNNIRQGGTRYLWRKTREKSKYFCEKLMEHAVLPAGVFCYRLMDRPFSAPLRFYWISQGHWHALSCYTFKPFPGRIVLVRAIDRGPEVLGVREDPTLGWGSLAGGGVEVIDVPTEHMHMLFEPYVATFAEKLTAILPS